MTSREKIHQLYSDWTSRQPTSAKEAIMLMAAQQLGPGMLADLPEDPAELDELLAKLAGTVLSMRSDDAAPIAAIASAAS